MAGNYTPLLLTVGDGITKDLVFGMSYIVESVLDDYDSSIAEIQAAITTSDPTIVNPLQSLLHSIGLSTTESALLSTINGWIDLLLGSGDNSRFVFHFQTLNSHIDVVNQMINSAVNSTDIASSSFTSMDNLLTGNISLVCSDPVAFGEDLEKTGQLFDLSEIDTFGSPSWLLGRLSATNAKEFIYEDMKSGFITPAPPIDVDGILQKKKPTYGEQNSLHTFFSNITGTTLQNILTILQVETADINWLSDLYSLPKLFPNCWDKLGGTLYGQTDTLFTDNKSVSPNVAKYIRLSAYDYRLPNEHSRANRAFAYAMLQIKNVGSTTPQVLAQQAKEIELVTGMDGIQDAETPMNLTVRQDIANTLSPNTGYGRLGTGVNNNLTLSDAMGSLIGAGFIDEFSAHVDVINTVDITGLAAAIHGGIVAIEGGSQTIGGLINELNITYGSDFARLAETAGDLNQGSYQIAKEKQISEDADLYDVDDDVMLSKSSDKFAMVFASTLHSYSTDEEKRSFLEAITIGNPSEQADGLDEVYYAQALNAALVEGNNLQNLNAAGIMTDTKINDTP